MKIAHRIRTGQDPIAVAQADYNPGGAYPGSTVNRTPMNGRSNRFCGPPQATQLNSWGAGCPPGVCGPDQLPTALGRNFAGMASGCRELAWTIASGSVAGGAAWSGGNLSGNAPITICPTRLLIVVLNPAGGADGNGSISSIKFGTEEQMVGGPIAVQVFSPINLPAVPFVMSCIKAGMPYSVTGTNLDPDTAQTFYLTFIGPAVG